MHIRRALMELRNSAASLLHVVVRALYRLTHLLEQEHCDRCGYVVRVDSLSLSHDGSDQMICTPCKRYERKRMGIRRMYGFTTLR